MNYFVEEIQKNQITNPIEILNWYRNLYYTENSNTERGIMAATINDLLTKYKIEEMKICYNCKHWIGGGDWGLSCKKDYYNCSTNGFNEGCKDFERRNN